MAAADGQAAPPANRRRVAYPVGASPAQRAELDAVRAAARARRQAVASILTRPEATASDFGAVEHLRVARDGAGPDASGSSNSRRALGADYVDYRISELQDTRGGFLVEAEAPESLDGPGRKRKNRTTRDPVLVSDPPIHLPLDSNPLCEGCRTAEVDAKYLRWYGVPVCTTCRIAGGDMYRMVTKSEAKEDFLVTEEELDRLRHVQRPNPHNPNWKDMKLYLYKHVYQLAMGKWGSEDKLNEAFLNRTTGKKPKKRQAAFAKNLNELARADRAAAAVNRLMTQHEHDFGPGYQDQADSQWKQRCECGFEIIFEPL